MLELRAGRVEAAIDPEGGGRLTRLAFDGVDVLTAAGCFLMAPWAGRVGWGRFTHDGAEHRLAVDHPPHAIHGTVRGMAWTIEDAGPASARISTPLGPGWPWPGRCEQCVDLDDDGVSLTAAVHAEAPFPAVLGWHPWFTRPVSITRFDVDAMLERGDDHLPTGRRVPPVPPGERPLDDCFVGVRWPVVLRRDDGLELSIEAQGCDAVVVYDEEAWATCVEPQTAPPDALRTGTAALVEPGRPLRAAVRMTSR